MLGIELMKRVGGGSGGGSAGGVNLTSRTIGTALHEAWKIDADGFTYRRTRGDVYDQLNAWITPQSGMSSYDIRATLLAGEVPDEGVLDTWQNLGTDRVWGWNDADIHQSVLKMEIRIAGTGSVIDTATITFDIA